MRLKRKKQLLGHNKIFDLVFASVMTAIILIQSLIPYVGFIQVGVVSVTLIHISVLIGITILPFFYSMKLGLIFGLGSLAASFIYGKTPIDLLFQNPVVSVLPRIIFSIIAWVLIHFSKKIITYKYGESIILGIFVLLICLITILLPMGLKGTFTKIWMFHLFQMILALAASTIIMLVLIMFLYNKKITFIKYAVPSCLASMLHSMIVILMILIFINNGIISAGILSAISTIILSNAIIEMILATIFVPLITDGLLRIRRIQ